jgi:hypothetical protein
MANRKIILTLVLVVVVAGWSFAQMEEEGAAEPKYTMPMNTVTIDIGPTIIGGVIGGIGSVIGEAGLSSSGFGIAAQYERQILEKFTVAGRFAYLGGGFGIDMGGGVEKVTLGLQLTSFSLEGHARFYPWARTFFLDGMLGYAHMRVGFSGSILVTEEYAGDGSEYEYATPKTITQKESIKFDASRSYFKLGAKIGWRIDFGKPGGFVFEPSFGYYGGIGLGDTLGQRLEKDVNRKVEGEADNISDLDFLFMVLEQAIFVGGPRTCLSFGWRF